MGLLTVCGIADRGYFIPYRYAASTPKTMSYSALEPSFRSAEPTFERHLTRCTAYVDDFARVGDSAPPEPRWRQHWFPGLDAAAAYCFVRARRPQRIVEIGSGHSTRFLARAVRDEGISTTITTIDPAPRADIASLAVTCIRKTVQEVDPAVFGELQEGDFLSVDSSHIAMPGSDVDYLINGVLPELPKGLLLHVHDIFLPDGYPGVWSWRSYNEQSTVAPLIHVGGYDLEWSSHYVRTRMTDRIDSALVNVIEPPRSALETSLWLRKR